MELPDDILLRSPEEAARRLALRLFEQAHGAAERWLDPADESALHDFRVAIRRLRSTLRAWQGELAGDVRKKHRRMLRKIQSATGGARDAQVALAWLAEQAQTLDPSHRAGRSWMEQRLEDRVAESIPGVRGGVRDLFGDVERALRPRLERMRLVVHLDRPRSAPRFGVVLAARMREHALDLEQHLAAVASPADRRQAHAARIRAKRLRYLAEPSQGEVEGVKALVEDCKRLQDLLGDLNDAHVLGADLDATLDAGANRAHDAPPPLAQAGLLELALRAEAHREALFVALERQWLGANRTRLSQRAEVAAAAMEDAARANLEIERKFLLSGRPAIPPGAATVEVEQGWLPGKLLRERVRRVRADGETRYFRTLKFGRGLTRGEFEEETSREIFEALWPLTDGCRVRKRRIKVAEGDLVWEIDEFTDRELWLAEVELPEEATNATPPDWLAPSIVREVTEEKGFTNLELATS